MAWSSYNQPALQALICGGAMPQLTGKDAVAQVYLLGGKANPVLDELGDRAVFVSMRDVADVLGISLETFRAWKYRMPVRLTDLPPMPATEYRAESKDKQKEHYFLVKEVVPWIKKIREALDGKNVQ